MAVINRKISKQNSRIRRAKSTRAKIAQLRVNRLSVHRTSQHMYAQVIAPKTNKILASASTVEADARKELNGKTSNKDAAAFVGKLIAERAKAAGVETVAFDRGGFLYHGRIQALADSAREAGLKF